MSNAHYNIGYFFCKQKNFLCNGNGNIKCDRSGTHSVPLLGILLRNIPLIIDHRLRRDASHVVDDPFLLRSFRLCHAAVRLLRRNKPQGFQPLISDHRLHEAGIERL